MEPTSYLTKTNCKVGMPHTGAQVSMKPLPNVILAAPCTTWAVADIQDTVKYLRGAKALDIPNEYKDVFPSQSWECYVDPVELEFQHGSL